MMHDYTPRAAPEPARREQPNTTNTKAPYLTEWAGIEERAENWTNTETLVAALRILARDIKSDDGVANAAIAEAAERLEQQEQHMMAAMRRARLAEDQLKQQAAEVARLRETLRQVIECRDDYAENHAARIAERALAEGGGE